MSKKHFGKIAALLMALAMTSSVALFASCGESVAPDVPIEEPDDPDTPDEPVEEPDVEPSYLEDLDDYRAYMKSDLAKVLSRIGTVDGGTIDAAVTAAYNAGVTNIENAKSVSAIEEAYEAATTAIADCIPLADGVYDYTGLSTEERTEILGKLESYALDAGLTGTTLYENGGYVMYSDRLTLGTETYISNYGFGNLTEGSITAPMDAESNAAWKMYYHTYTTSDPGTANYLNSQDQDVSTVLSYMAGSFYTTFMNSTKDGYDWVPELALSNPEALNDDGSGSASKWRIELRQDAKYSTLGKYASEYNGKKIELEDYLTPFKLLLNQANAYYRGGELAAATGASTFVGASDYYNATENSRKGILSDEEVNFSEMVGIRVYEENGKWYFEYELGQAVTPYYARYYIASNLYEPIPASFVEMVGVENYLGFASDGSTTPVDNSLSVGPYVLEQWDADQQIVYKKNTNYVYSDTKYSIEGIHMNILTAAQTDNEAGIKEFLAGKIDGCSIPDTYLDEYRSDPRTRSTLGDSCFKLNMNALTQEDWNYYFGVDGIITQTPEDQYWECEPAMSNAHFRSALSYAINRSSFAASKGVVGSVNYFSSNYMSDPENGISYNVTDAHKNAIAPYLEDTDEYGYSLELAREYFRMALDELEAEGAYTPGTKENPTIISLDVYWMYASQEESYHKYVKQYWEDAFNDESVSGGLYKLEVNFYAGDVWSDVYYKHLMVGQYDIGFGSISGNALDPLNFMSVLSSDATISGSFTLNWAVDTNDADSAILVYNGMRWSYDALYLATQQATIVDDGENSTAVALNDYSIDLGSDKATVSISITSNSLVEASADQFILCGYNEDATYTEVDVTSYVVSSSYDEATHTTTYTLEIPSSEYSWLLAGASQMIDVYWSYNIPSVGISSDTAYGASAYMTFVE